MKNNDDLLNDSTIDTVYIPPPNSLHKKWTVKAMEAGKHVLLEKLAVLTEEKMIEIKRLLKLITLFLMEAFMYQFHSQYKRVKELFESDFIGNHHHIKVHFSWLLNDPNNIRLHQELGGAMWDVGCYGAFIHLLN